MPNQNSIKIIGFVEFCVSLRCFFTFGLLRLEFQWNEISYIPFF